jgi:NitT/TauT family transport system permease protein
MGTLFSKLFRPTQVISPRVLWALGLAQAGLATVAWLSSSSTLLPGPLEVLRALQSLWFEQGLGPALATSALVNLEALVIASFVSFGLVSASVLPVLRPAVGLVSQGRFLGLSGLTFVFTVALGGGHALRLALLTFGMTVFLVTSMSSELAAIPPAQFDHARTLRMSDWRVVWEVVVLGTADRGLELIRQNAAIGWTMLTMVESFTRAEGGVGALLFDQNRHLHLGEVFALQLTILAVGLVQDAALGALRKIACPYADLAHQRGTS